MAEVIAYSNEFIDILKNNENVIIYVKKPGLSMELANHIFDIHPDIEFDRTKVAIELLKKSTGTIANAGKVKRRITIDLSDDEMVAYVKYNVNAEELETAARERLIRETAVALKENGIVYGIKSDLFMSKLENGKQYIIAEGTRAVDGEDSEITMFEIKEAKPEVIENEKYDYYNLSLITIVDANTWLGERKDAVEGSEGTTVTGQTVRVKKGISLPLHYDRHYVYEKKEPGKTVLYSKVYGAVYYNGRDISLMNPLIIDGDVDFKTGNIVFDGHVRISGTICDGFYVEAENDIEVNSEIGLGNIKGIVSRGGSIFVKGGIICKGNVTLKAAKNIYVKFAENANIICGGTAHIGFYSSNSNIEGREIIIDSLNGKLLGGNAKAEAKICAPVLGSDLGKKTLVEVTGFDRETVKAQVDLNTKKINDLKSEYEVVKKRIASYESMSSLTAVQDKILADSRERLDAIREEVRQANEVKDSFSFFNSTRGDGEIKILKRLFPNTSIKIKNKSLDINEAKYSTTFIFQGRRIIEV